MERQRKLDQRVEKYLQKLNKDMNLTLMRSQNLPNKTEIATEETKEGRIKIKKEATIENRKSSRIMTIKLLNF